MLKEKLNNTIRDVADFPRKGITFKDITPVLENAKLCSEIIDDLAVRYQNQKIDVIAGIESRGFFFGFLLANRLGIPFIPIRKAGKLPFVTVSIEYALEYGTAKIEMNADAIKPNSRILIHDDLLATGGTAAAAAELITQQGGVIAGFAFVINLAFLEGSKNLTKYSDNIYEIISYGSVEEDEVIIPNTLEECFIELKKGEGLEAFTKGSEKDTGRYHHSLGQFLRNEWGLWKNENDLCKFFHSIGINHADDMSSIILVSLHRNLNNSKNDNPIDLKGQVLTYWKHWSKEKVDQHLPSNIVGISEEYLNHYTLYKDILN